jgi:hypothetical protein
MKRLQKSSFSAADFSADRPASSTEGSNGSTETIETAQNQDIAREEGSSISSIDPQNTSYFIQYHPELAEKFSNLKSNTYSVSGRCLSIVFSRMLYWSRFARHRHQGKLFYWKNQTELSEETFFSVKTINRALKILVEMGLLVREKIMKHRYFQCYFYHIPVSPFTKEIPSHQQTTRSTSSRRSTSGSSVHQRFHSNSAPSRSNQQTASASPAAGAPAPGASPPISIAPSAVVSTRKIGGGRGFGKKNGKCPIHSTPISTSIKHTLKSVVERCNLIGKYGIETINGIE